MSFLESRVSRGLLLRSTIAIPTALFLVSEADKALTGVIKTPFADYYPCYEDHSEGIDLTARGIPDPWDYHWREFKIAPDVSKVDFAASISEAEKKGDENTLILSRRGVRIATADINAPVYTEGLLNDVTNRLRVFYEDKGGKWDSQLHILGSAAFFVRWKFRLLTAALSGLTKIDFANPDKNPFVGQMLDRSTFLRKSLLIPFDIATGYIFVNTLTGGVWEHINPEKSSLPVDWDYEKMLHRVFNRLHGLLTHTRPNDMIAFFRNLLWAEKLSELAEKESQRLGRRLNISYQVDMGHGGFEDLLQLGRPFTTTLLGLYPKEVWRDLEKMNNDGALIKTIIFSHNGTEWNHERDLRHDKLASIVANSSER